MAIIVELVSQDEQAVALNSFDADAVSIGRSLDNDFVVTDPYVDPHHLRITVGDSPGTFFVEDRNTLNGSRLGRRRLGGQKQVMHSGGVLHIGKTSLRISDSSSSVAPARKLTAVDSFYDWAASGLVSITAVAAVLLYATFSAWSNADASTQAAQYFDKLANPLGTLLITAAFWSIVGRIVKRRINFVAHLTIAALTQFLVITWSLVMSVITVNLSVVTLLPFLSFLGRGVFFVASVELHLRLATNVSPIRRLAFELLALVVLVLYPVYKQIDAAADFRPIAPYNSSLLPPSLQFYRTTPAHEFMRKAAETLDDSRAMAIEKMEAAEERALAQEVEPENPAEEDAGE